MSMEHNYLSANLRLDEKKAVITTRSYRQFNETPGYVVDLGQLQITTPHLSILEGMRDACNQLIAAAQ